MNFPSEINGAKICKMAGRGGHEESTMQVGEGVGVRGGSGGGLWSLRIRGRRYTRQTWSRRPTLLEAGVGGIYVASDNWPRMLCLVY